MPRIEIEIRDYYVSGAPRTVGVLDIKDSDDYPLSLNYLIADIKNLAVRSGTYSKTFNVPATKNNNQILHDIWNPNTYVDDVSSYSAAGRRMLSRKACIVKVDSEPILRGDIKVKNIITKGNTKEYVLILIGDNSEWVKQFESMYLNELTEFDSATALTDHTYNKATIEASWSGSYSGLDGASSHCYFYPLINYGSWKNDIGVVVEDMKPAVYIRAILDAAFREAGYSISSTFLDTTDFKKLVMPFIGDGFVLSDTFIDNRKYRAAVSADQSIDQTITTFGAVPNTYDYYLPFNNDSTNLNFDTGSLYDNSAYKYVANANYKANFEGEITIQALTQGGNYNIYLRRTRASVATDVLIEQFSTIAGNTQTFSYKSGYINLQANDEVQIYMQTFFPYAGQTSSGYVYKHKYNVLGYSSNDRTYIYNEIDKPLSEGASITLKDIMPDDVSVLDIIKGLSHLYNLYYRTDTAMKVVYIEPRDSFFDDITTANDWTAKLNKKDYKIQYVDDYKQNLWFQYKRDSADGHLRARDEEYDIDVGEYRYAMLDRFMIGTKKYVNPTFAATYHIMDKHIIYSTPIVTLIKTFTIHPLKFAKHKAPLISRLWREWRGDDTSQPLHFNWMPRILMKSYGTQEDDDGNNRAWDWDGTSTTNIPTALMAGYDDVTQDNLEFNGTDGLFQTYYGKYIKIIEKGVIVTALFDLKVEDISEINLKNPVYISKPADLNGYYVINRIIDYSPTKDTLTKVELVKIENLGTSTYDSGQVGTTKPTKSYGEIKGNPAYIKVASTWSTGSGGKFDDDDILTPVVDDDYTVVLQNGSNNKAYAGSGSFVAGTGLTSRGQKQTILGSYNNPNTTDIFQVGVGSSSEDRVTGLKIDKDGEMTMYGGQVQAIVDDVVVDVLMEDEDNERYIKVYKSE